MSQIEYKKLRRFEHPNHARFVTFSCYQRLPLLSHDGIRALMVKRIELIRQSMGFALLGWVMMPEHVHMVMIPKLPEHPVPRVLHALKRPVAQAVVKRWRHLQAPILEKLHTSRGEIRFWQPGGGYDRNLRTSDAVIEVLQYMHENPVARGLVSNVVDWPWSSARFYVGRHDALMKMDTFG